MDMIDNIYKQSLAPLVKGRAISLEKIDEAVKRLLRIKFRLGLFEHPYVYTERAKSIILSKENIKFALQVARKSIVLLKNDQNILPIDKNLKRIAVIGLPG